MWPKSSQHAGALYHVMLTMMTDGTQRTCKVIPPLRRRENTPELAARQTQRALRVAAITDNISLVDMGE